MTRKLLSCGFLRPTVLPIFLFPFPFLRHSNNFVYFTYKLLQYFQTFVRQTLCDCLILGELQYFVKPDEDAWSTTLYT